MARTIIQQVTSINHFVLMVFYTGTDLWQFRVISPEGGVYGKCKVYHSARAAEHAGRKWLEQI
ncbi:MAG: hypothetical protein IGS39_07930 [Calothrix sp. C42_A2020_038]|nr:hypothetical protein [Calothrix sp. C42_A2020_038]